MSATIIFCATPGSRLDNLRLSVGCAAANAGCRVVHAAEEMVSGLSCDFFRVTKTDTENIRELCVEYFSHLPGFTQERADFEAKCLERWFITENAAKALKIAGPIIVPDWDYLVFYPVEMLTSHWDQFDLVVSTHGSSPVYISHPHFVSVFCGWCLNRIHDGEPFGGNDMDMWRSWLYQKAHTDFLKVGNGNDFSTGIYADSNVHRDLHLFANDAASIAGGRPAKAVAWRGKRPCFILASNDVLYPAFWIHCWGSYKQRMADLCRSAGVMA